MIIKTINETELFLIDLKNTIVLYDSKSKDFIEDDEFLKDCENKVDIDKLGENLYKVFDYKPLSLVYNVNPLSMGELVAKNLEAIYKNHYPAYTFVYYVREI